MMVAQPACHKSFEMSPIKLEFQTVSRTHSTFVLIHLLVDLVSQPSPPKRDVLSLWEKIGMLPSMLLKGH